MKHNLENRFVFLSASYPQREYKEGSDSQEIASAVRAFAGAVFHAGGRILFGGHPSISPLVLMMAQQFGEKGRVCIYQSEVFEGSLSEATLRLRDEGYGEIVLTNADPSEMPERGVTPKPGEVPHSLSIMREEMLSVDTNPAAAVLIGGDTGIFKENSLFATKLAWAPVYAVGGPGGAARELALQNARRDPTPLHERLATSTNYLSLMVEVVKAIGENLPGFPPGPERWA